jgi:DNA adenine methylase
MSRAYQLSLESETDGNLAGSSIVTMEAVSENSCVRLPHPIPYQGSKRNLATKILSFISMRKFRRLYEPFAGSAAFTIAAAHAEIADEYFIGDSLAPLIDIWSHVISAPDMLADAYERLWYGQIENNASYYNKIRDKFNRSHDPASLLYLLARCVKNSPRFNQQGSFNQSPDKRRLGMHPNKMRDEILGASAIFTRRTTAICADFEIAIAEASNDDVIYMDPPYEGTSAGGDKRYHQGLDRNRLIRVLADLNKRGIPFLLSYDGRCGEKMYGAELPEFLNLMRIELNAGRSSQSTLNGRTDVTIESLYVSNNLINDH